jgi:glycine cleavage system aminomethyltransferase T
MSLEFLSPSQTAIARSPMERDADAAGARFELRGGWNVAVSYAGEDPAGPVAFADFSHLRKLELQGGQHDLTLGTAELRDGAWWCPITPERTLVIGGPRPTADGRRAIDVTTTFAALTIAGPASRELFARFSAIDLRPHVTPPRAFRPGSVARTPGFVLRENGDRYLMLFGAALGHYMWTTVADAAASLGGGPVGVDALAPVTEELAHA